MTRQLTEVTTFVGPLRFVWDDEAVGLDAEGHSHVGAVVRTEFGASMRERGAVVVPPDLAEGGLALAVRALRAWSSGADLDAMDAVPVMQDGSEFRRRCWQVVRSVKAGDAVSYSELATLAGNPGASRAAGSAMANNETTPFTPCHRVVRAGGIVGNFSSTGGGEIKTAMLRHEGLAGA